MVVALWVNSAPAQELKPAATVNGSVITMADLDAALKRASPPITPLSAAQKKQMQIDVLGMLIDDALMEQFLRKYAPPVPPGEVNRRIAELEAAQKKQGKTMQDFYRESGQTEVQLRINMLNMIQWLAFLKDHLSDADVKRYYDESRDFFDRVSVRASHIVLRLAPNASQGDREKAQAKLRAIRQEILSGAIDFAEAAKKHSQDATAPNGGDIGFFPRKFAVDEAFARAAFGLKPGEISDIVETDYGLHLIKVTERKPGNVSDFEKIKDQVREFCAEEMRLQLLAQQRKTAKVQINLQ
jgi:peptidyl-prolyl cis-trans isomerase C